STSTYGGAIVDAAGGSHTLSLISPAGTLALTGTSTFSGGTTINAGILSISSDGALGAVPPPATPTANITFNSASPGGTLRIANGYSGGSLSANRGITVNSLSNGTLDTNGNTITAGGLLTNNGNFVKAGAGTLELNRLSLSNGSMIVANAGSLRLNVSSA